MKTFCVCVPKGVFCHLTRGTFKQKASNRGEACFETPNIGSAALCGRGLPTSLSKRFVPEPDV